MSMLSPYDWSTTASSNTDLGGGTVANSQMYPSGVDNAFREMMAEIARTLDSLGGVNTVGGTASAITVTIGEDWSAYATGQLLAVKASSASTGTTTLNVTPKSGSALGAKAIRRQGDSAIQANDMLANGVYLLRYDASYNSAAGAWVLLNPAASGALASYLALSGGTMTGDVNFGGHAITALASVNGGALAGFRNQLINGSLRVWQRGTSISVAATSVAYTADNWFVKEGSGTVAITVAQQANPTTGVANSIRVQRNSSNTNTTVIWLGQIIESLNAIPLQGATMTLSFYAKCGANYSPTSSILVSTVYSGTTADEGSAALGSWTGQATAGTQNNTLTTSRQQFTMSVSVPIGCKELAVVFAMTPTGTASTNDWFEVDSVQLEPGSTATPFEQRPYGVELPICQRYLRAYGGQGSVEQVVAGRATATSGGVFHIALNPEMRATPSLTISAVNHWAMTDGGITAHVLGSLALDSASSTKVALLNAGGASGLTGGQGSTLQANSTTSARLYLSAEL